MRQLSGARRSGRGDRLARVSEQLRQELSSIMVAGMKDERIRLATVSDVEVSRDLRSAKVRVSAVGTDAERAAVVAALRHAEGFLRGELGRRLENLKTVPHMTFTLDESIAYSVRIQGLLRDVDASAAGSAAGDPDSDRKGESA